jgi:hypothetical protein
MLILKKKNNLGIHVQMFFFFTVTAEDLDERGWHYLLLLVTIIVGQARTLSTDGLWSLKKP